MTARGRRRPADAAAPAAAAIERAVARLADALGDSVLLIGGFAVSAWGYVRATDDVDFVSRLPGADVVRRLAEAGVDSRLRRGGALEGEIPWCVTGSLDGVAFDVLPPLVPLEFEQAITVSLGGRPLRVVDLDGLLRLKLRAGGPQDLIDAAQLLRRHPERVGRIRTIAEKYGIWRQLETWMHDPRLR